MAAAYKEAEAFTVPAFSGPGYGKTESIIPADSAEPRPPDTRPFYRRFFGVLLEPRAWGALFYLFISMATGIFYFTWVTVGLSTSLGLMVLIVGLPFAGLFILSVRGLALVEGRIVEALLGVRMPRRPVFQRSHRGWWHHFKAIMSDEHTWLSIIYMLLQLPLGILYFTLFIVLFSVALSGIVLPITQLGFDLPVAYINGVSYYLSGWILAGGVIAGILLGVATMHLAKAVGRLHGSLARSLLVRA